MSVTMNMDLLSDAAMLEATAFFFKKNYQKKTKKNDNEQRMAVGCRKC